MMIFAYFLMKFSSLKMNSDRLLRRPMAGMLSRFDRPPAAEPPPRDVWSTPPPPPPPPPRPDPHIPSPAVSLSIDVFAILAKESISREPQNAATTDTATAVFSADGNIV